jgi:hypothetical protein
MEILFEVLHYLVGGALCGVALIGLISVLWVANKIVDILMGESK